MASRVSRLHFAPLIMLNLVLANIPVLIIPSHSLPAPAITLAPDFDDTLLSVVQGGPMDLAWTPDGRILIPTQEGQLWIYANRTLLPTPAIDLSGVLCTEDERGLEGIAVHPSFPTNHYVYLYYTFRKFGTCNQSESDGPVNRLSRFVLTNTNLVDPASEVVLLDTPPLPTSMHNGGDLKFGNDGYLYLTAGDAGTACCSSNPDWPRNPGVVFGKVLRLTDSGSIPPNNPFTGAESARCNLTGVPPPGSSPGTKCQEVFAMGLRNPFRFAFDPNAAGVRFFINDVGENAWEEVDQGLSGVDYGWPIREGPCAADSTTDCGPLPTGLTNPVYWYGHNVTVNENGCYAITGGAFVPNGIWPSPLDNSYLFVDFICGQIWTLRPDGQGGYNRVDFATLEPTGPVSMRFGPYETTQALFYVTRASGGQLRRISYTGSPTPATLARNFRVDWSDYDNDGRVAFQDITVAALVYDGASYYWDYNLNGKVDILDIAMIAFYYNLSFSKSPYPGQGLPHGMMDPSWRSICNQLPKRDQNYCYTLP